MSTNRWNWLEGLKPESAVEVGVKYVASMIADELSDWPPRVIIGEDPASKRFAELLEPGTRRPSLTAFHEAVRRARWELARDYDAIDHYERNHHLADACPSPRDRLGSELMRHFILESFFELIERTENRVKRADVLVGLELLEGHVRARWSMLS
jgi:hypothetical protein